MAFLKRILSRRARLSSFSFGNKRSFKPPTPNFVRYLCSASKIELDAVVISINPLTPLHIGHYFGVLKECVRLQEAGNPLTVCIADLEALSMLEKNKQFLKESCLRDSVLSTASTLIACGIDADRSIIVQQSKISGHSQLDWIFQCLLSAEQLKMVSSFKLNEEFLSEMVNPILKCTDYLLYKAKVIPARLTFSQQYSLICATAESFNNKFGYCFPVPKIINATDAFVSNIRNLRNPDTIMTSFTNDSKSYISLIDTPDLIKVKTKKAVTDFTSAVYFDEANRPGVSNLMAVHKLVSNKHFNQIEAECNGLETSQYKTVVADALIEYFSPIRKRSLQLLKCKEFVESLLCEHALKANNVASNTLKEVYCKLGFSSENFSPQFVGLTNVQNLNKQFLRQTKVNKTYISKGNEDCPKKIFSGIQPTGILHLGNYFGAVIQWVNLQNSGHDVMVCLVDQHAITVDQKPNLLLESIATMLACIVASGVQPDKSIIYQQSMVAEHAQLNVLLRTAATRALLSRQAHYKDKLKMLKKKNEQHSLGLLAYPVLQAADILLYQTTDVPVGEDQIQHIELARQVAQIFNNRYGITFTLPKVMLLDESFSRLKSLQQPLKKMSKSDCDANSRIEILDAPEVVVSKILGAVTGDEKYVTETNNLGIANLMAIHSIVSGKTLQEIQKDHVGQDVLCYKRNLGDCVAEYVIPIRLSALALLNDKSSLAEVLAMGAAKARLRAQETLQLAHQNLRL